MKIIAILILVSMTACSHAVAIDQSQGKNLTWYVEDTSQGAPATAIQHSLCDQLNGRIEQTGLHSFACVFPSNDAGRICDDSSDCEGLCRAPLNTPAGTAVKGTCSANVNGSPTGNTVNQGRASGDVIVD